MITDADIAAALDDVEEDSIVDTLLDSNEVPQLLHFIVTRNREGIELCLAQLSEKAAKLLREEAAELVARRHPTGKHWGEQAMLDAGHSEGDFH